MQEERSEFIQSLPYRDLIQVRETQVRETLPPSFSPSLAPMVYPLTSFSLPPSLASRLGAGNDPFILSSNLFPLSLPSLPSLPPSLPSQVVELAHFLVLDPLLRLALARVHFVLKATPLEEFKRLFLFQNDLTPDEEKVGRKGGREGGREGGRVGREEGGFSLALARIHFVLKATSLEELSGCFSFRMT